MASRKKTAVQPLSDHKQAIVVKHCITATLLEMGLAVNVVAEMVGYEEGRVSDIKHGRGAEMANQMVEGFRAIESLKWSKLQHMLLDSINADVIDKATLQQRVVSAGIAKDKRDGHQITVNRNDNLSDEDIEKLKGKLLKNLALLEGKPVVDAEFEAAHPRDEHGRFESNYDESEHEWKPRNPKAILEIGDYLDDEEKGEDGN